MDAILDFGAIADNQRPLQRTANSRVDKIDWGVRVVTDKGKEKQLAENESAAMGRW